jgi:endoglycosylceramidase
MDDYPVRIGHKVEDQYLAPLYRAAADAIRAVDADRLIFYESTVYPKFVDTDAFAAPPLGADAQQAYSYHVYCADFLPVPKPQLISYICNKTENIYEGIVDNFVSKHKQVASFLTEFGAITGSRDEISHVTRLLEWADSRFQSWAYWQYKYFHDITTINHNEAIFNPDGQVEPPKVRMLSRTYAQATAGLPVHMSFDAASGNFVYEYTPDLRLTAPTELYLNEKVHYPHGYDLHIEPLGCWQSEVRDNQLRIKPLDLSSPSCKNNVHVRISGRHGQEQMLV